MEKFKDILINKIPSNCKIILDDGSVFYAHNLPKTNTFVSRKRAIQNFSKYFSSIDNPTPIQNAYAILLWNMYGDYLNACNFTYKPKKEKSKKDLYVLRNNKGFIKVGITTNINVRIVDLKFEFDGEFEVIHLFTNKGHLEKQCHAALIDYTYPVKKRYSNKYSTECFEDCDDVLSILTHLVQNN